MSDKETSEKDGNDYSMVRYDSFGNPYIPSTSIITITSESQTSADPLITAPPKPGLQRNDSSVTEIKKAPVLRRAESIKIQRYDSDNFKLSNETIDDNEFLDVVSADEDYVNPLLLSPMLQPRVTQRKPKPPNDCPMRQLAKTLKKYGPPVCNPVVDVESLEDPSANFVNPDQYAPRDRRINSIRGIFERITSLFPTYPADCDHYPFEVVTLANTLGIERRRLYDVLNVLQGLDIIRQCGLCTYLWKGQTHLVTTLSKLKNTDPASRQDCYSNTPHKYLKMNKRCTLNSLAQQFMRLCLIKHPEAVSWEEMSCLFNQGRPRTTSKSPIPHCDKSNRRLYDVSNVLIAMGLVEKVRERDLARRNRNSHNAYLYVGPEIKSLNRSDDSSSTGDQQQAAQYDPVPQRSAPCRIEQIPLLPLGAPPIAHDGSGIIIECEPNLSSPDKLAVFTCKSPVVVKRLRTASKDSKRSSTNGGTDMMAEYSLVEFSKGEFNKDTWATSIVPSSTGRSFLVKNAGDETFSEAVTQVESKEQPAVFSHKNSVEVERINSAMSETESESDYTVIELDIDPSTDPVIPITASPTAPVIPIKAVPAVSVTPAKPAPTELVIPKKSVSTAPLIASTSVFTAPVFTRTPLPTAPVITSTTLPTASVINSKPVSAARVAPTKRPIVIPNRYFTLKHPHSVSDQMSSDVTKLSRKRVMTVKRLEIPVPVRTAK